MEATFHSLILMRSSLKKQIVLCLLVLGAYISAPAAEMRVEKYHAGDWENDIGYCQAVRVGQLLYISGTTGAGKMPEAIRGAYDNLAKTLKAHGLTFKDVVKENIYTTDIDALKANNSIRLAFYDKSFPAATWVQVQRLYLPDQIIEIELTAVFPQ